MKIWLVILLLASHCQLLAAPLQTDDPVSGDFPVGSRVEIDGRWDGQSLEAIKLVREEPDEFREIKGVIESIDIKANTILVGPFTILITEDTDFDDADDEDDSPELAQLEAGWRLNIEGVFDKPFHFRAFEVEVDTSPDPKKDGIIELEGFIEAEELDEDGVPIVVVNGIRCRIGPGTEIPDGIFRKSAQRRIQWDDWRPSDGIRIHNGNLLIGGRIKHEWEERDNHHLNGSYRTDRQLSISIEATWPIDRERFLFGKGNWKKSNRIDEEDDDNGGDVEDIIANQKRFLEEFYYFQQGVRDLPVSLQIGRMDFDEGREWFYDTSLDAVRLEWEEGPYSLEASWSTLLGETTSAIEDRQNRIFVARWRPESRTHHALYIIDIVQDREEIDFSNSDSLNESPFFVGIQSHGRKMNSDLRWWVDGAYVSGVDGVDKISAFGIDASVARRFRQLPWTPYLFG
ncbi:MAG: alginate export family protein, partial [Planctomycetota bacterium]